MSPNVGNFVHDLVEMAKAMETLPQVEHERDELKVKLDAALQTVQDRELSLIGARDEINLLNAKVRSLEVERDDASFRVLEVDETIQKFVVAMRNAEQSFGELVDGYDPKGSLIEKYYQERITREGLSKPEPVKEPEPIVDHAAEKLAADPFPVPEAVHSVEEVPQGQSESSPTASTGQVEKDASSTPVTNTDAGSTSSGTSSADPGPALDPYSGKRYFDQPAYISRADWLAGGGTEEDYHWRPSPTNPDRW